MPNYTFRLRVTDSQGNQGFRDFTVFDCVAPLTIDPATLPDVYCSATDAPEYTASLTVSGGSETYVSVEVIAGELPPGITATIVGDEIVFSGTMTDCSALPDGCAAPFAPSWVVLLNEPPA